MFTGIKNTVKTTNRLSSTKDTITYVIQTLKLRAEVERLEKIQKNLKDKEQKDLVEIQIKQLRTMYGVYKDAAKRAFESALD